MYMCKYKGNVLLIFPNCGSISKVYQLDSESHFYSGFQVSANVLHITVSYFYYNYNIIIKVILFSFILIYNNSG